MVIIEIFKARLVINKELPWDKQEYYLILEDISYKEILNQLVTFGEILCCKYNNLYLFYLVDMDTVYGKEINDGSSKEDSESVGSSNIFIALLLSLLMIFNFNVQGYSAITGSMEDDNKIYNSFKNVEFKTPTGSINFHVFLTNIMGKKYNEVAYTLNDPRKLNQKFSLGLDGIDKKINQDMVVSILAFPKLHTLTLLQKKIGLNITDNQLVEAVQLSLWRQSSLVYKDYQIIENSIIDSTVRSLSTYIDSWASEQISHKPSNTTLIEYLLPSSSPKLEAKSSKKDVKSTEILFGGYSVKSSHLMKMSISVENGKAIDTTGKEISTILTGDTFFISYPSTFSGISEVTLKGESVKYSLAYSHGRVWLHQDFKDNVLSFSVSTLIGANGTLNVNIKDTLTDMPLQDVVIEVKSKGQVIDTLYSDKEGSSSYQLPQGDYFLNIKEPNGFLDIDEVPVSINFIGDIQTINIGLSRSEGVVNLHVIDASTLGNAGYAEAYIFKDDIPIKRLAFNDGECLGISLPSGTYRCIVYKTSNGYSISDSILFNIISGEVIDVSIPLMPNTGTLTLRVEDTVNKPYWKMTFYEKDKLLFSLNTQGEASVPFKLGEYQVIAETIDGSYKLNYLNFKVNLENDLIIIPVIHGTSSVTLSLVDTIEEKPIPSVVVGLFDDKHNLLEYKTADIKGVVTFSNIMDYNIYYLNVIASPPEVSGYSKNGNRFIGSTREYVMKLYSLAEIEKETSVDTLFRIPNVTYQDEYTYPVYTGGNLIEED